MMLLTQGHRYMYTWRKRTLSAPNKSLTYNLPTGTLTFILCPSLNNIFIHLKIPKLKIHHLHLHHQGSLSV